MRRTAFLTAAISIVLACALAVFSAGKLVDHIERHTVRQLATLLNEAGENWATIRADGFQIIVGGLAENEATRYRTLQLINENINQKRVYDKTNVSQPDGLQPPKFSLEVLRNVERVSLIGLIPASIGREYILEQVRGLHPDTHVTDMLEQTDYPAPDGWQDTVDFALSRLKQMPRSKISLTPGKVKITAVSDTPEEQQNLQISLAGNKPEAVELTLDISAPRPVITPFLFRLKVMDGQGMLDACSADNKFASIKIVRALARVNLTDNITCKVGLGVPTTDWSMAVILAIDAMKSIGSGTITLSDSDISLIASENVEQADFDVAVAKLENALPKLFSLQSVLTPKPLIDGQTGEVILPDFTITKSPEGLVQMRGQLPDQLRKDTIFAYATSLFGTDNTHNQTRIVEGLPDGWTIRSMAGLEAMSHMRNGSVIVLPDEVIIKGKSDKKDISSIVSRIFATRVGTSANYTIDVKFDKNLVIKPVETGISN
ncbi:MAG: OmpA family protein, partial [Proteobacteria bacterium]|nr:OmpA family protein [Pseudomonadota bacterium]